jgi:transcriptional regulator with XRE-family HTH domain
MQSISQEAGMYATPGEARRERLRIGGRVREARRLASLSQARLAAAIGYTPSHVSYVESGDRRASDEFLSRAAEACDLTPQELTGDGPLPSREARAYRRGYADGLAVAARGSETAPESAAKHHRANANPEAILMA